LEFARQEKLDRIAVRLMAMDSLPPQLQGILPLNFTEADQYQDSLMTLLEDIQLAPTEPIPELPEDILTGLYSENIQIRRNAIEALRAYRSADETLREFARDELNALGFREREPSLKSLIQLILQSYDKQDHESEPNIELPSKEELVKRAEGHAVIIKEATQYLWQSNRWLMVLGALGILLGSVGFILGGHWAYLLPPILVGFVLAQLNIAIRQGGEFEWQFQGALIGNLILGLLVAAVPAVILLLLIDELSGAYLLASLFWGGGLGLLIGWLSSLEV
jgi:hypothetical protein